MTLFPNRTNYVRNPSGEVDTTDWTPGFSSTTVTRDATHVAAGSWAIKAAWATESVGTLYVWTPGLIVGVTYAYALRVWVPTGSPSVHADVFFNSNGSSSGATKDAYVILTGTFTATGDGHYVGIVTDSAPTSGMAAWCDAVIVVMGASQSTAYFDGATADDAEHEYLWLGAAHASASEEWVEAAQTAAWPGVAYPGRTYPGDDLTFRPPPLSLEPMGIPLVVRLRGSTSERMVTREVRDLKFDTAAPGGFGAASISLNRPLILRPGEFSQFGRLYIYDGRSGETMYEGRLDDPGRTAGADGEVWSLTAVGGSAHTTDISLPLIYLDRSLDGWEHSITADYDLKNGTAESRTGEDDGNVLYVQIPAGTPVAQGDRVAFNYMRFREAVQKAALINYQWDAGGSTPNYQVRCISNSGSILVTQDMSTSGGDPGCQVIGTDFTVGDDIFALMIHRSGSAETPGVDTNWVMFWDLRVGATRFNADGTEKTSGYSSSYEGITTSEVITDLLGRCLPSCDGGRAVIEATTYHMEHLAYPDAVTPRQVLDDIATFEPGYYWAVWESTTGTDLFRFEYRAWPNAVRYEATVDDGFDAPTSGGDLYSAVKVRWKRPNGRLAVTTRTATVPLLEEAVGGPLERIGWIDAGDNTVATVSAAQKVGDQFLAEHNTPGNAGRLRIARPIWDHVRGRMVQPWEIRAGALVRVRGTLPNASSLNVVGPDAVTVFRIAGTAYSDGVADLELNSFSFSEARALAEIDRKLSYRRRR